MYMYYECACVGVRISICQVKEQACTHIHLHIRGFCMRLSHQSSAINTQHLRIHIDRSQVLNFKTDFDAVLALWLSKLLAQYLVYGEGHALQGHSWNIIFAFLFSGVAMLEVAQGTLMTQQMARVQPVEFLPCKWWFPVSSCDPQPFAMKTSRLASATTKITVPILCFNQFEPHTFQPKMGSKAGPHKCTAYINL